MSFVTKKFAVKVHHLDTKLSNFINKASRNTRFILIIGNDEINKGLFKIQDIIVRKNYSILEKDIPQWVLSQNCDYTPIN